MLQISSILYNTKTLQIIGVILLLIGAFALLVAPIEIFTFYSFTSGGKFHFEGFEFGSFMFALITVQVFGYYAIAVIGILLGYGHMKLLPWTPKLTLALLWDWIVLGGPLSIIAFLMLITSKNIPPSILPIIIIFFLGIYPVLPLLLIKFYTHQNILSVFPQPSDGSYWLEHTPQVILVMGTLMIFFIAVLHIPLLFNGFFPLFGRFMIGLQGVMFIDLSVVILIFLAWGVFRQKLWAWLSSVLYFCLMIVTSTITFLNYSLKDIIALLKFAPMEQEMMQNIPIQSYHFLLFLILPLLITLIILITSKTHFTRKPSP